MKRMKTFHDQERFSLLMTSAMVSIKHNIKHQISERVKILEIGKLKASFIQLSQSNM